MTKFFISLSIMASLLLAVPAMARDSARGDSNLKINEIQVLGTHNSYSPGIDPLLAAAADSVLGPQLSTFSSRLTGEAKAAFEEYHPNPGSLGDGLKYSFPPLASQLDAGLRSLEIDIYMDPEGGRYAKPAGYAAVKAMGVSDDKFLPRDTSDMEKPGLKVFHIADLDQRSTCNLFVTCLQQLRAWSDRHPGHAPIFILIEAKGDAIPVFPGSTVPLPFDRAGYEEMDQSIFSVLGRDRVVTPDQVRAGFPTLEAGVLARNWPTYGSSRGKFVFLLLTAADTKGLAAYIEGRPNLEGRAAFLRSTPGQTYSAFLLMDNATLRAKEIPERVLQGYLVRARADIETYEAKVNDPNRAIQAFRSGAQVVSTDFYRPGNAYGTSYVVKLPGGGEVRCNPVNAPRTCKLPR